VTLALRPPDLQNLHGEDGDHGREHISHSAIGAWSACREKYRWSRVERLVPAVTRSSLSTGRAFAHALEHNSPHAGEVFLREQALAEVQAAHGNPWLLPPAAEDIDVQATVAREAARAYLLAYGAHQETREYEARVRIRNPRSGYPCLTHDLVGRVDAVSHNHALLIEDKLVGKVDHGTVQSRLWLDRQVTIGCYLIWRCTGVQVTEVKYRHTLKPSIRRRQNESHAEYLVRVADDYVKRPEFYLHEETLTRTPEDFLRLEVELWDWVEQIRGAKRAGVFTRNTGHCRDFGGCEYLPLCAREPGANHQFVTKEKEQKMGHVQGVLAA
jgi:hypothetical protein